MVMTTDQFRLREEIREDLLAMLRRAMAERGSREELVDGELGWVCYERQRMHAQVNHWRAGRGLPPVSLAEIERVERSAEGHVDYAEKFALRCTELAVGVREREG